jgi:hypothetical protein
MSPVRKAAGQDLGASLQVVVGVSPAREQDFLRSGAQAGVFHRLIAAAARGRRYSDPASTECRAGLPR